MPGCTAVFILDSSFFLSGFQLLEGELFTIPEVVEEIGSERKGLLFAKAIGLRVLSPPKEAVERVKEKAKVTGDETRMSETDILLLALALELRGILLTDDYSMQNTAEALGIPYRSLVQKGIKRVEKWYFRCAYCGRYLEENYPECPVCGGPVRTVRRPPGKRTKGVE
ncbi:MAG: hypothetical protein KAU14_01075 [Thermoplasmata archaeon]|nr:hypothetical protein [Thermoplasmata archaeon]